VVAVFAGNFLNGVGCRRDSREERAILAPPRAGAVDQDVLPESLAAVDAKVGRVRAAGCGAVGVDAAVKKDEGEWRTSAAFGGDEERQFSDLSFRDVELLRRTVGLQHRSFAGNCYLFAYGAGFERHISAAHDLTCQF